MIGSKLLRTAERRDGNRPCRKLSEKGKTVCNSHLSVLSYSLHRLLSGRGFLDWFFNNALSCRRCGSALTVAFQTK